MQASVFGFLDNALALVARKLTLKQCGVPRERLIDYGAPAAPAGGGSSAAGGASVAAAGSAMASLAIAPAAPGAATGDFGEVAPEDEEEEYTEDLT